MSLVVKSRVMLVALASMLAVALPGVFVTSQAAPSRPNVVVIIVDDMSFELLARMPNVRSLLVDHGLSFSNAFAVDPLCCPSRVSFLRGQYSHTTGEYNVQYRWGGWAHAHASGLENRTLPVWLNANRYYTAEVGKYLNGYNQASWSPPGWDLWRGMLNVGYQAGSWTAAVRGKKQAPSAYSTDWFTDQAVSGIKASGSAPLFLWAAYYAPHAPSIPPARYDTAAEAPACAKLDVTSIPGFNERATDRVDGMTDKPRWVRGRVAYSAATTAKYQAAYVDQCRSLLAVDEGVARIIRALNVKDPGLGNSIVVFTSDQGVQNGAHMQRWKKVPWDESARLPFVVRADGLRGSAPATNGRLVLNIDLAPTLRALTGSSGAPGCPTDASVYATTCRARGGGFDGVSFAPLLTGRAYTGRKAFLIEHWDPAGIASRVPTYCAVRTRTGLLTRYVADARSGPDWEGYDLTSDPNMLHSLVHSSSDGVPHFRGSGADLYAALVPRLRQLCRPRPPNYPRF